jgi:hypothetical protein
VEARPRPRRPPSRAARRGYCSAVRRSAGSVLRSLWSRR